MPQFPELIDHVPAVEIGILQRPFDTDDALLVQAVADAGGGVHIGLKPLSAPPLNVTGMVPAITKAEALSARATEEAAGAEILRTFRNSATLVALIDPDQAADIQRLPVVSYLEPTVVGHLALTDTTPTSTATAVPPAQDTTWGVFKVRAPQAWAEFCRGGGAYIAGWLKVDLSSSDAQQAADSTFVTVSSSAPPCQE